MKYIIDTYAWIEYLNASRTGEKVKQIVDDANNELITHIVSIAELASALKRRTNEEKVAASINIINSLSQIKNIDFNSALKTGELHAEMRKAQKDFGMADAFILQTARETGAKIVTGDEHFRKIKEAILIR